MDGDEEGQEDKLDGGVHANGVLHVEEWSEEVHEGVWVGVGAGHCTILVGSVGHSGGNVLVDVPAEHVI